MREKMDGKRLLTISLGLIVILGAFFLGGWFSPFTKKEPIPLPYEAYLKAAGALKEQGFYAQSQKLYEGLLSAPGLPHTLRGNVAYLLGKMELEHLEEPASAYAHLLLAEEWVERRLQKEIQKLKVSALERSGQSYQAAQLMKESVSLNPEEKQGKVVARIGKEEITDEEVRSAFDRLPPTLREPYRDKGWKGYVPDYVSQKLLVRAAKRAGLDKDPRVLKMWELWKEELLKNAYLQREIQPKISVTELEARAYFQEHPKMFSGKKFEEVRQLCFDKVQKEKESKAMKALITRLMQAEHAEILLHP